MDMVGTRGTCDRGRSGCVIVRDKRIISTGYVGSPVGIVHCDDVGHEMHTVTHENGKVSRHCIRTAHAEQNAIAQAARVGTALAGSTIYCNMTQSTALITKQYELKQMDLLYRVNQCQALTIPVRLLSVGRSTVSM